MSKKPLLSICIPAYNGSKFIKETLESILSEKHPEVEVVVVDDKSTDDTFEVISRLKDKHPAFKIKVIRNNKNFRPEKAGDRIMNAIANYIY